MIIEYSRSLCAKAKKVLLVAGIFVLFMLTAAVTAQEKDATSPQSGRDLFLAACVACHGPDGRGMPQSMVGFDLPFPDFTASSFASREPLEEWVAVSQIGGPVRRFSERMPAFRGVLSVDESTRIAAYIKTFHLDKSWPAGELNLPRPLVTEKAFPEDEVILASSGNLEGAGSVSGEFVYEKRIGSRNQVEVVIPYGWSERDPLDPLSGWDSGVGDIGLAFKRAVYHHGERGTILSAAAEFRLPTGNESRGFGKGTAVLEPFVLFGQILPSDFFVHGQAGVELPLKPDKAGKEAFFRAVIGKSLIVRNWVRMFSPMIELLAARELEEGAVTEWDIVPQMQVTLSRRQHIMLNFGVRVPLNETSMRSTQFAIYVLWDWYDGGLFNAW